MRSTGGRLQPVLMRPTPQLSFKTWGGGGVGGGGVQPGVRGGGVPAGAGQFSLGTLVGGRSGTTICQNPGGGGGGAGGGRIQGPGPAAPP